MREFEVTSTAKGDLKVSTRDCCIPGDTWRATITKVGSNGAKSKLGNGSITNYSGEVKKGLTIGATYRVLISADDVPNGFPAGLEVCFEGPLGMTVTPQ